MRLFKDFIAAIQRQNEFDPEAGNIIELMYIRRFRDDDGRMLASKYAYVRAFHQRKPIIRDDGTKSDNDVFWVLPDDCTFAMDGEEFVPVGVEEFPPEGASDEITLNWGHDYMEVTEACRYSERINNNGSDRCVFYRIVGKVNLPF